MHNLKLTISHILCLLFLLGTVYSQTDDHKIEFELKKLALTPMPEYEVLRDKIVKEISVEELNNLKSDIILTKIMLPIIKLHKQHKELVDVFNAMWWVRDSSNRKKRKAKLKALGIKRPYLIPELKSNGIPTGMPLPIRLYIESDVILFIWPYKGMLQKDLSLKSKINRAYWAKITILEYLLKYEKDLKFEKFFKLFATPIRGLDFSPDHRYKFGFRYLHNFKLFKDGLGESGDILIPRQADSNARMLYDACVLDFLLQYCGLIPQTVCMPDKREAEVFPLLILKLYRSKSYSALKTVKIIKNALPSNILNCITSFPQYSEPKFTINELLDKVILELSKKKCKQINWISELSEIESTYCKRHPDVIKKIIKKDQQCLSKKY